MKKQNLMRTKSKVLCGILAAAMVMAGMTACSSTSGSDTVQESSQAESSTAEEATESSTVEATDSVEEAVTYYGQISAIEGNSITVELAEMPQVPPQEPDGQAPEQTSEASEETAESETAEEETAAQEETAAEEETSAEEADSQTAAGEETLEGEAVLEPEEEMTAREELELQLTGETMTIEVDEETIITVNGETAAVEDLQTGDIITFIMQGEKVNSVTAGMDPEAPAPEGGEAPAQVDGSSETASTAETSTEDISTEDGAADSATESASEESTAE